MRLEGEERQAHVGEDEVLCQKVEQLKQLRGGKRTQRVSDKLVWDLVFFLFFLPGSNSLPLLLLNVPLANLQIGHAAVDFRQKRPKICCETMSHA